MRRLFAIIIAGSLLLAGAAFADTPLPRAFIYDGAPVLGEHADGEILVMLEVPATGAAYEAALMSSGQSVAESIGAQAVQTYGAIAAATGKNIVHMKGEGKSTEELLTALSGKPGVIGASPSYIQRAMRIPDDPRYGDLWGMRAINAPDAWDITTGSENVYVGIIDTGIDYNHEDLAGNIGRDLDNNIGRNITGADPTDPMDTQEHGSHVAGTIGAVGNNAIGVTGVNWKVSLLAVQVFKPDGLAYDPDVIAGLNYLLAQKNRGLKLRAVNMSIGGWRPPIANPVTDPYGSSIKALADAGVVIVIAAGNEGQDIDNPTGYMDNDGSWVDLRGLRCYPACFRFGNTITVASMTADGTRSDFSNYSPNYVDLAAPGSAIISTTPGDKYKFFQGTSMAAPHVAGATALVAAAHPTETAAQIKARLLDYVTPNANFNGLVDKNGHLNVDAAIRATAPTPPPEDIPVTGITVSQTSLRLAVGQSATLTAVIAPENATNKTVDWTATNLNTVIEGVQSGLTCEITGLANGSSVVTVTTEDGGFSATCNVTVGTGGGGGGGGGCSVGASGAAMAAVLLLAPIALLLGKGSK
ncbi:MAG: S8 family serine peptidase [Synergistaceae bacterium]|nr:S8 family serine peptidase [Synergistota bacterium]NLM72253.1 S8 family serine peptidase [Synergistaceae bacterium]